MSTRIFSFIALIIMIVLLVMALPGYVSSFENDPPVASIVMSGIVVVVMFIGAAMLLLFGVIGVKGSAKKD